MQEPTPRTQQSSYAPPKPLYEQVKSYVIDHIDSGEWPPHCQLPSEHTLVRDMGISRMTIHRAMRELTQAGYIERIQGVGTFVASPKKHRKFLEIKEINDVIRARREKYQCDVHFLQEEPLEEQPALEMGMKAGEGIFRSYFVHRGNNVPLMIEDRHVQPKLVPDFLNFDFSKTTIDTVISTRYSLLSHEHQIQAVMATPEMCHFLELKDPIACLLVFRKTWLGDDVVSIARMLYPGDRYQLM